MAMIDTGGSAFPYAPPQDMGNGQASGYPFPDPGMSLRDYFAAAALPACIQLCASDTIPTEMTQADYFAVRAYECADAMLRARRVES